jgi:hypothetical protein
VEKNAGNSDYEKKDFYLAYKEHKK